MAESFTPTVLANMEAQTAFLASLNANFSAIAAVLADVLSLSGVSPNSMEAVLDMNSNRIINLPSPVNPTDVVRLQDLTGEPAPQWIKIASGAPSSNGFPGQVYIDNVAFNLYVWNGNTMSWSLVGSLQGPSGPGTGNMLTSQNLSGLANYATARTNLGLAIGTNVEAWNTTLDALAGKPTQTFGMSLLNLANAAALQALLTLGGAALLNVGTGAGTVAAGNDSRFYNVAPNTQNANYTFATTDRGGLVLHNTATAYAWTIPPGVFNVGDVINVRASVGSGTVTLTRGAGVTSTLAGTSTNKDYALAAGGAGSIICEATNVFYILGSGIS